jgi:hypothetical protein
MTFRGLMRLSGRIDYWIQRFWPPCFVIKDFSADVWLFLRTAVQPCRRPTRNAYDCGRDCRMDRRVRNPGHTGRSWRARSRSCSSSKRHCPGRNNPVGLGSVQDRDHGW